MTVHEKIAHLKKLAKLYARIERQPLSKAQDALAKHIGFKHWNALQVAHKNGWLPHEAQLLLIEDWIDGPDSHPFGSEHHEAKAEKGVLRGHSYRLLEAMDDIIISGDGWSIIVPEAPSAATRCEVEEHKTDGCPLFDAQFRKEAVGRAREAAEQIKRRIAVDWDRRSLRPAQNGTARHPLGRGEADTWYCLHCNGRLSGQQVCSNFWHCANCGASPLDIFPEPFWLAEGGEEPWDVKSETNWAEDEIPEVEIVEARLKLKLNQSSIELLIRTAFLEDATNTSERLGVLCAEVFVDEDSDVSVILDEDLWPDGKEPARAFAVAAELGIELDLSVTMDTAPFAWPDLGVHTSGVAEYTRELLQAYREYGVVER